MILILSRRRVPENKAELPRLEGRITYSFAQSRLRKRFRADDPIALDDGFDRANREAAEVRVLPLALQSSRGKNFRLSIRSIPMNEINQRQYVVDRRLGQDAVAEVENMARPAVRLVEN